VTQDESEARAAALTAEIALAEFKECIEVYGFVCHALNISVAEASAAGDLTSLEEQEQEQITIVLQYSDEILNRSQDQDV
jgi:hypothetical protein